MLSPPTETADTRLAELQASFTAPVLARGEAQIANVQKLQYRPPNYWLAVVNDPSSGPQEVSLGLGEDPDGPAWACHCTCPVETQCEHAAAALLYAKRLSIPPMLPLAPSPEPAPVVDTLRPSVLEWMHRQRGGGATPPVVAPTAVDALYYGLFWHPDGFLRLQLYKARLNKSGTLVGKSQPWSATDTALLDPPRFVGPEDLEALRLMRTLTDSRFGIWHDGTRLSAEAAPRLLPVVLRTGRAGWQDDFVRYGDEVRQMRLLKLASPRKAVLQWLSDGNGQQHASLRFDAPGCSVMATSPPWYVDLASGEAGEAQVPGLDAAALTGLLVLPQLSPLEAAVVASTLSDMAPTVARPKAVPLRRVEARLVPVLHLSTVQALPSPWGGKSLRGYNPDAVSNARAMPQPISHARLSWRYGMAACVPRPFSAGCRPCRPA